MVGNVRTIIVLEDGIDFTVDDFIRAWNAEHADSGMPIASHVPKNQTFDAAIMEIVGDIANILGIAGFVGVPPVAAIVSMIRSRRNRGQAGDVGSVSPAGVVIEETIIDFGGDGKVQRITVRRQDR